MTDEEVLLQAVIVDPDADSPRLIYADWLEERGDPRGEFIRVQCELAKVPESDPRWLTLENREYHLLDKHEAEWTKPIAKLVSDWKFHRGFVDTVTMGHGKFVSDGDKLFRKAPIRDIKLTRLGSSSVPTAKLAEAPLLSQIRGLELSGTLSTNDLRTLLSSPHLKKLHSLSYQVGINSGIEEILLSGVLPNLQELKLTQGEVDDRVLFCAWLPFPLKRLAVASCSIYADDLAHLADAAGLKGLTYLDLSENQFRVSGGQDLAASKHLTKLTTLILHGCLIGVGGTQALAESKNAANLVTLDLRGNNIGDNGVRALTASKQLKKLEQLYLGFNGLGSGAIEALVNWPGLERIRLLHFYSNHEIGDALATALAQCPLVKNLHHLDLGYTDISDKGVIALAESPHLQQLRHLVLDAGTIGDAGVTALAQSPKVTQLRSLSFSYNDFRDAGVDALIKSPHLAHLRQLTLKRIKMNAAGQKALIERFGSKVCRFSQD